MKGFVLLSADFLALCGDFHNLRPRGRAGLPAGHAGSRAGIGRRGAMKNVGTNADVAGRRPAPRLAACLNVGHPAGPIGKQVRSLDRLPHNGLTP